MFESILSDAEHYKDSGGAHRHLGFWVGATYRFGSWAHGVSVLPLKLGLLTTYKAASLPWMFFKNVDIPARTKIGPGLCLHHPFNIIVPWDSVIGANCSLYHDVTLGLGPVPGVPTLGDNVTVFAGAKVLGGITIGDNVEIGANAVVTRDVPSGSVVSSAPSRTIPPETMEKVRRRHILNGK